MLPDLTSSYEVPGDRIAEFREKGHTILRGVATADEVAAFRPVIEAAAFANSTEDRPLDQRDTYGKAFLQVSNLWTVDDGVRRFTTAPRFAQIAADLLGVDGVRIYHDQALFKEASGGRTPFHQDQYYFPLDCDDVVTMWMPLVSITAEMGSLAFASGSNHLGDLGEFEISDESEEIFRSLIADKGLELETHGAMAAGDATFHAGWTLHGAEGNRTDALRSVMTVIWFADGSRGIEPQHEWHEKDYAKWLPGVKPGEVAASHLNPLVFTRGA